MGSTVEFGPRSEFGFEKLLQFFCLPPSTPDTGTNQVRHTLGFCSYATPCQKNLLVFMQLHPRFGPLLVVIQFDKLGYSRFNFMRASSVVKRQSTGFDC